MANMNDAVQLIREQQRSKQEDALTKKVTEFLPRAAAKFKEDTKDIQRLKQPPTVKLMSKDGRKMWVPRRILLARSQVFKHLLEEKEETDILKLDKVSSKTLEVLVEYLETGALLGDWMRIPVVVELCEAAVDYELPLLVEFLKDVLVNLCNSEDLNGTCKVLMGVATKLEWEESCQQIISWMSNELAMRRREVEFLRQRRLAEENLRLEEQAADRQRRRRRNNAD